MTEPAKASPEPVFWPKLTAGDAAEEWPALREWVTRLGERFPHAVRLPACWWRHNDLVELLAALRDYERASYRAGGPMTGPVEFHRAFREVELRLELWIKRLNCGLPGREHDGPNDWQAFVKADAAARPERTD